MVGLLPSEVFHPPVLTRKMGTRAAQRGSQGQESVARNRDPLGAASRTPAPSRAAGQLPWGERALARPCPH